MTTLVINSDVSLQSSFGAIRELYQAHRYVKITAKTGKARSLDQNSISHAWYEQLSRELKEDDALGWKCHCKLHFGVPILRAEDDEYREIYDNSIKNLGYEQKLIAMRSWPVTSLMTKEQLSKYLVAIQESFKGRVFLEFPDEPKGIE